MLNRFYSSIIVVAVAAVLWHVLDANPTLFFWDLFVPSHRRYSAFRNKTIWVTGASSGIGADIVCELVQAQARHVILSARRVEKLQQVAEKCRPKHDAESSSSTTTTTRLSILRYDAAAPLDTVENTVQSALDIANGDDIDVLILNAGMYQLQPALQTTWQETRQMMQVNFESPVALATALIHKWKQEEKERGHIVVVASLISRGAQSLTSSYAASKAALRNYFYSLSTEEALWLQVNIALPGATNTELWNSLNTTTTRKEPNSSGTPDTVKMNPQRVARLILTGASGPYWLFYETFISKPIGLIWIYMSMYFPVLFHWSIHLVGYIRVELWNVDKRDALDIPTLVKSAIHLLVTGRVM